MVGLTQPDRFVGAPAVVEWIRAAFLEDDGPLFSEIHSHLRSASIGVLWTNASNSRHGKRIVGQAEMTRNMGNHGAWQRARMLCHLRELLGEVPDFLITLDSVYASQARDVEFAALIDHELTHCAQQEDEFGMPAFVKSTGMPKFCIKGHDVQEFVSVVRRFGIEAAGPEAVDMVIAAAQKPVIGKAKVAAACGVCIRAVA